MEEKELLRKVKNKEKKLKEEYKDREVKRCGTLGFVIGKKC